jgi:hypothetical protein
MVSIGLILLFLLIGGSFPRTPAEWLGFLFFPLGISIGMVLAWRREGLGGGITVCCLVIFYAIHYSTAGTLPRGWAWLAFAAPGLLFLVCSYRSRNPGRIPA